MVQGQIFSTLMSRLVFNAVAVFALFAAFVTCFPPSISEDNDLSESLISSRDKCLFDPDSIGSELLKFVITNSMKPEDLKVATALTSTMAVCSVISTALIPFTFGLAAPQAGIFATSTVGMAVETKFRQAYLKKKIKEAEETLKNRFLFSNDDLDELKQIKMKSNDKDGNAGALIKLMQFCNKRKLYGDAEMFRDFYFNRGGLKYKLVRIGMGLTDHSILLQPLRSA